MTDQSYTRERVSRLTGASAALGAVLILFAGAVTSPASAADTRVRFVAASKVEALPPHAKAGSAGWGRIGGSALDGATIELVLPDGRLVSARRTHLEVNARVGSRTWRGEVPAASGDALTLTESAQRVTGTLEYRGTVYELQPRGDRSLLYAVDPTRLPATGPLQPAPLSADQRPSAKTGIVGLLAADQSPVLHDLLVLTTAASRARFGSSLEGMISNAVTSANAAYVSGDIGITLNLVAIRDAAIGEAVDMGATLDRLVHDPAANALRDSLGADVVMLVSESTDYCGIAFFMNVATSNFADYAYGVLNSGCLSQGTLVHEIGHVQGLSHDRETAGIGAQSSTPYAFGYRVCRTDGTGVRDIMSYSCTSGAATRINQFSNPDRIINGHVFGVAYELDPANAADAARALNDNAAIVAGFRAAAISVPAAPALLPPTIRGPTRVDLAWQDASDNEQGFAIERSVAAAGWSEIARTGPEETALADVTVAPSTTYSYRVRAYNSAGYSAASNVVTLTTPALDTVPDAFSLSARLDVAPGTLVTSAAVTITGIEAPTPVTVSGGEYSIGCTSDFSAAAGTIAPGQAICVRHTSAATPATTVATLLTIGGVQGRFESTTRAAASAGGGGSGGGGGGGGAAGPALLLLGLAACLRRSRRSS
jgi:hypothetical protein